ncbi:MAG: DUF481 domain-containing protein [Opitutaceae bacterium]|nr:DUF481 domain-containing protein [Opitutaceae bacterium]
MSVGGLRADVLKFKNGDQVKGTFIKKDAGKILFRSERFGDLSASEADATVELTAPPAPLVTETEVGVAVAAYKTKTPPEPKPAPASSAAPPKAEVKAVVAAVDKKPAPPAAPAQGKPAAPPAAAQAKPPGTATAATAAADKTAEAEAKSLLATTVRLGKGFIKWWGGWHGSITVSASIINDTADRSIYSINTRVKRTWKHDEVQFEPRYEFRRDDDVTTVDTFRTTAYWRHTFGENWFGEYRATYERRRKGDRTKQLEQQFGTGRYILKSKLYKLNTGLAANYFNTWPMDKRLEETEYSQASVFGEASLTLPWRITVTERGTWYFMGDGSSTTGWQNAFELTKKLSNALSFGIRHEIRRDNPDPRVADYETTRFLLGFNF